MDVVFKHTNDFWFNEIKTCHSSQAGIRDAIGQRLEYAHWPKGIAAEKMIVVGDQSLGFDEVCLLCDDTALVFTALTDGQPRMRDHLQRFLGHTRLACPHRSASPQAGPSSRLTTLSRNETLIHQASGEPISVSP